MKNVCVSGINTKAATTGTSTTILLVVWNRTKPSSCRSCKTSPVADKLLLCNAFTLAWSWGSMQHLCRRKPMVLSNLWPGPALSTKHHMTKGSPAKTHRLQRETIIATLSSSAAAAIFTFASERSTTQFGYWQIDLSNSELAS